MQNTKRPPSVAISATWAWEKAQKLKVHYSGPDKSAQDYWAGYNAAIHHMQQSIVRRANKHLRDRVAITVYEKPSVRA